MIAPTMRANPTEPTLYCLAKVGRRSDEERVLKKKLGKRVTADSDTKESTPMIVVAVPRKAEAQEVKALAAWPTMQS